MSEASTGASAASAGAWPRAALALILGACAIRLFVAGDAPLGYGESYYLASVRDLAWSWFDQPPLALWVIGLDQRLFGEGSWLLLRLPQLLCFALLGWRIYAFTARQYGARAGFLALLFLELAAVFGITAGWMIQPDALFFLFWWLSVEAFWRALNAGQGGAWSRWLLAGLLLGLTLLAKYPGVLLGLGVLCYLLFVRRYRGWLLRPQPYVAALLALALQAPVFFWNWQHDWISFAFQGGRAVNDATLDWARFLGSILGQVLWVLPWVWLVLVLALVRTLARIGDTSRAQSGACDPAPFLAVAAIPTLVLFSLVALWLPIGLHFHWQAPGYLLLLPLAGAMLDRGLQHRPRLTRTWILASVLFSFVALLVIWGHGTRGWLTPFLGPELAREDDTREMIDWSPLAAAIEGTDATFMVTNRWHQAGKAETAIDGALPVFCFCDDPRNMAFGRDQADFIGRDALILQNPQFMADPVALYGTYFRSLEPWSELRLGRSGREEVTLRLWLARDLLTPYPMPYGP